MSMPRNYSWVSPRQNAAEHCGPEQLKTQTKVLSYSLVRLLVRSHRSLIHLLCLRPPLRLLVCSLAHFADSLACGEEVFCMK